MSAGFFDRTCDHTRRGNRHPVGNLDALADADLATDAAIAADAGRARDGCLTGDRTTCANHRIMSDQHLAVEYAPPRDDGVTQHSGVNDHMRKDRIVDHQCVALAGPVPRLPAQRQRKLARAHRQ